MPILEPASSDAIRDTSPVPPSAWRLIRGRERRTRLVDLIFIVAWSALTVTAVKWVTQPKGPLAPPPVPFILPLLVPMLFGVAWYLSGLPVATRHRWLEILLGVVFVAVALLVLAVLVAFILVEPAGGILTCVSSVVLLVYLISWS
jgi:hypothetical protein